MLGEAFLNDFADAFFGIAVSESYRGGIRLAFNFDPGAVVRENFLGSFVAEFHSKSFEGFILFGTEFRHNNQIVFEKLVGSSLRKQPQKFEKTHSGFDLRRSFPKLEAC